MQSMVTIRPHQAQAKVMVLPTEEPPRASDSKATSWFRAGTARSPSSSSSKTGLTSIIRSKLSNSSPSQTTAQDNLLCTLPRTTLQRRPAHSAQKTTPQLGRSQGGHPSGPRQPPELQQQSMVTVSPYDTGLACSGLNGLNGCDTDDSSDSQYASVANLPSPASSKRLAQQQQQQQQQNYYTTNRLQPSRQSSQYQTAHRNPYVSPQLSRLTSTLRPYGYNPMDTCSNSSACSSPQRTILTNLSSSSTTVSSAQLGSPHLFYGGRFQSEFNQSDSGPILDSANLGHVYCEIPASNPRLMMPTTSSTGNYDNIRWQQTPVRGGRFNRQQQQQQPQQHHPRYCRETEEDETVTYADDTVCDLHNVSDLSDDEFQQRGVEFWPTGPLVENNFPFPVSECLVGEPKSPKKKKNKKRVNDESKKRSCPGVEPVTRFTTSTWRGTIGQQCRDNSSGGRETWLELQMPKSSAKLWTEWTKQLGKLRPCQKNKNINLSEIFFYIWLSKEAMLIYGKKF